MVFSKISECTFLQRLVLKLRMNLVMPAVKMVMTLDDLRSSSIEWFYVYLHVQLKLVCAYCTIHNIGVKSFTIEDSIVLIKVKN